jgi:portal protein
MSETLPESERAKLIARFREEFEFAYHGEQPQRQREDEDLRFQVPEMQWDEESAASRRGRKDPGGTIILPRPMLSISKIDQPIRLVMNQFRQAKLGINIHPVSPNATDDTAGVIQDLIRRIERDSNANVARGWALDRAVKCGRGVYRVVVRPDEDGFNFGDLEIGVERILHQGSVWLDPSAQLSDYSDGDFAWVTTWMRVQKAARLYPGTRVAQASTSGIAWSGMMSEAPLWTRQSEGAGKSIQVGECLYKKHEDIKLLILDNGEAIVDGEGKIPRGAKVMTERVRDRVEVWSCITDGFDILEPPKKWLGKYIPLIPVLGRELQPFDEQRRIIGIIRNARDPQRFYNTSVSTLMERMFLEPRTPWVMFEGQDKGREADWAQANYRNIPVLKAAPVYGPDGQILPLPQRTQVDGSGMSVALMGVQQASADVQEATAFFDPSLGKTGKREESGRHALALQGQGDAANGDWLDNLAVAMRYEALCEIDLIPAVYDAPGRVTTVIGGANAKPRKIMLNRAYVVDPNTGEPVAAGKGAKNAKFFDLRNGARYGVEIEVGTSFKTRLQEADEATTRIVEVAPELVSIIGDLLFENKDFPGAKDIADRMMRMIRAQHPELFEDQDGGPEQIAAKAKALEAQVNQLGQQLKQAMQALETDKVKEDAKVQIEMLKAEAMKVIEAGKAEAQYRIAEMNNAAKIEVARISAAKESANQEAEAQEELLATGLKIQAEAARTESEQDHERRMQMADHRHDVGMAAAGANKIERTTEGGQETGQERSQESSQGDSAEQTTGQNTGPAGGEA